MFRLSICTIPGVALQLDELASVRRASRCEQPVRRRGFHHDVGVRACAEHRVDDLDGARRVAEAVPRNVKDDGI